ncbi:MAG: energy transducer TonB [Acidobacteriota bacterium]
MFTSLIESEGTRRRARKPLAISISILGHTTVVLAVALLPTMFPPTMAGQRPAVFTVLTFPGSPSPAPGPARGAGSKPVRSQLPFRPHDSPSPITVPARITMVQDLEAPQGPVSQAKWGLAWAGQGVLRNGTPGGVPWAIQESSTPLPPPIPAATAATIRITPGGDVRPADLIRHVKPTYPLLAREARIEGRVILEAIIGKDGQVTEVKLLSGHPLLVGAAIEAVRLWRYRPTLLNGQPVEVLTQITVNFTLSR